MLSLLAAAFYGAGDFAAGLAGRRIGAGMITVVVQAFGLAAAGIAVLAFPGDPPSASALGWGAASGVGSALGTLALYRGLAVGQMSVVAPLSAVVTAALPVIIGLSMGEHLSLSARVGVGAALPAICLISWGGAPSNNDSRHAGFAEGALSGVGFALLFVSLARAGTQSGAWPLVPGQVVALVLVLPFGWRTRRGWQSGSWTTTLAVAAGVLCGMANLMFLAATSHGQLSIIAVLTSLYPAVTVLFARLVLRERWNVVRIAGFVATAVAIVLITVG